jgi:hypothetical protein
MASKLVTLTVMLSEQEALALAQLLTRVSGQGLRQNAADDAEARTMRSACDAVRAELAHSGYSPR